MIKCGISDSVLFGTMLFGRIFEMLFPLWLIILFDPRKIEPVPIPTVKNIKIIPIKKEENQTCCVPNARGSLFANASIEKLGDMIIPESAKTKVKTMELVHIPLYDKSPSNI